MRLAVQHQVRSLDANLLSGGQLSTNGVANPAECDLELFLACDRLGDEPTNNDSSQVSGGLNLVKDGGSPRSDASTESRLAMRTVTGTLSESPSDGTRLASPESASSSVAASTPANRSRIRSSLFLNASLQLGERFLSYLPASVGESSRDGPDPCDVVGKITAGEKVSQFPELTDELGFNLRFQIDLPFRGLHRRRSSSRAARGHGLAAADEVCPCLGAGTPQPRSPCRSEDARGCRRSG